MKRVVLTGAPCSGKTAVSTALAEIAPKWRVVPEAATQVYSADGTRWDRLDVEERKDRQRRIYWLQVREEEEAARGNPGKNLLLDRGTVDGAAYWPDGQEAYWRDLGTTLAAELKRYDMVILMETAAAVGVYAAETNACRFEDAEGAIANGKVLEELWGGHSNVVRVKAFGTVGEKIEVVKEILDGV